MDNDMINKKNEEQKDDKPDENVRIDVLAHLVIKEKETGKVVVNKRG